ncbi:MAG: hypothetical protein LBG88_04085 [Christensenellaceae bacterium]|nr:hypothetical protein [Christensenellaceae bacterium]
MLFENFKNHLKDSPLAPAYNFKGSDVFLISKATEFVLQKANVEPINVIHLDEDTSANVIDAHLRNVPMFGGLVAVIIRGDGYTKVAFPEFANRKEWTEVDCNPMSEAMVVKMIMQNKKFTSDAATTIARAVDNNFSRVSGEMEKLLCYYDNKETIDATDADAIITKTEKYQVFELSNALLKRDSKKIGAVLEHLAQSDVDDYALFASLLGFCRRLFYVTNSKLQSGDLAKTLGVHPYAVISTQRDSKWIPPAVALRLYECALELEHEIKSGKILANRATVILVGQML